MIRTACTCVNENSASTPIILCDTIDTWSWNSFILLNVRYVTFMEVLKMYHGYQLQISSSWLAYHKIDKKRLEVQFQRIN